MTGQGEMARASGSTVANVAGASAGKSILRRTILVLLGLVVLAGGVGLLGVKSGSVADAGDGYALTVDYAQIARAGLDVPFDVTVTRTGGFDEDVILAMTADYFKIFEHQGVSPEPDSETSEGPMVYMTFLAPQGEEFHLIYDVYIQGSSQLGASGEVWLIVDDRPVLEVAFTTVLLP